MFDVDGIVNVKITQRREHFPRYVTSFCNATLILLKSAIYSDFLNNKYTNDLDEDEYTLIFAIMFNYRHFIELAIKTCIKKMGYDLKTTHPIFGKYEKLEKLWIDKTRDLDTDFWYKNNFDISIDITGQFVELKDKIKYIDSIDKDGTRFRYPDINRKEIKLCLNEIENDAIKLRDFFDDLAWAIRILNENGK